MEQMAMTTTNATFSLALAAAGLLAAAPPAPAQQTDGARLFQRMCASCHGIEPRRAAAGPHLGGVVGRAAGAVEGARYSAAMAGSGVVWDDAALDAFLADPRDLVPGTTMAVRVRDADQRAAIIAFLRDAG
jgi:cytochrome c